MELSARVPRARAKITGVRLDKLRAFIAAGDLLVSPESAARILRACQDQPNVTRQIVALWAQRHGTKGSSYLYEPARFRPHGEVLKVSLAWLAAFLERTGRGLEAPANG